LNRRTLLKRGLFGGAVLLLGGTGLALFPSGALDAPIEPLSVLTAPTFGVLVAVARRVISNPGANHVAIAHRVDRSLVHVSPEAQEEVRKLLGLFENALAGLLFDGRVMPFTRLSARSQDAVLDAWRRSSLEVRRSGYGVLRKMCAAAHYVEASSWDDLHYPPPPPYGLAYDDSMWGVDS
jgi:hypothetical protein